MVNASVKKLSIVLTDDKVQADISATVFVDHVQVAQVSRIAGATAGGTRVELGTWSADADHTVTAQFTNGAGVPVETGENLGVKALLVNDVSTGNGATLLQAGTVGFTLPSGFGVAPVSVGGTGPDHVVLTMSEDMFQGDAQFYLTVDGRQLGELQTASALRAVGAGQDFSFNADLGSGVHSIGVRFVNDAWDGTPDQDRNLFVNAMTVNGVDQGVSAAMYSASEALFQVGTPPPPVETILGSGSQTLSLSVNEDSYLGDARFDVSVDGKVVAAGQTVTALRRAGQSQLFTIKGDFGPGTHSVGVAFTNDAYAGSAALDRNLFVTSIKMDGVETLSAGAGALYANGAVTTQGSFFVAKPGSSEPAAMVNPVETIVGTGNQTLSLVVNEDEYLGDAMFDVSVDGTIVASGLTATAVRATGQSQLFTIKGEFGAGSHSVGIAFVNDAYAGSAALDRNLFVSSVKLDGVEAFPAGAGALYSNGAVTVQGSFAAAGPAIIVPDNAGTSPSADQTVPPQTPAVPSTAVHGADGTSGLVAVGAPIYKAGSHVITVGVGKDYARIDDAIAASNDGDVLLVDAGTYTDQTAKVFHRIDIIGVGGRVVMNTTIDVPNQKGILVSEAGLRVVNIDFVGAHIADELGHNAAGIRIDAGTVLVENCQFIDNQNGILSNAGKDITVSIDHSVFDHNGGNDDTNTGNTHNIYIGDVTSFSLTNSISKQAQIGHEVKSRAEINFIDNNVIESGTGIGTGSYAIDLPSGGKDIVTNNTIVKGPGAENRTIIHFGGEGIPYSKSSLLIQGNLIQNTENGALGILNQTSITVTVKDNQVEGLSYAALMQGPATLSSNVDATGAAFADSVLTGVLPGSTVIYAETDKSAHSVQLNGGQLQAVQGGGGQVTVDVIAGHVVVLGGSGGMVINESATSGTGANQYTTMAGSVNTLNLTGGGSIDSEGIDQIIVGDGNSSGQLNGTATVIQAGKGNISWGVNGSASIQTGVGSTFISLGAQGNLTLTGTNDFFKVDGSGGNLWIDTINSGTHVNGSVIGGAWTMQTYGGVINMATAGGSDGAVMTMNDGDVSLVSRGADEFHAGTGRTTVQVSGNAKIYAGTGSLEFYGHGSSGADFYGNGGTYYLGGDTGNITYHGGALASTLNNDLGRGTILGGAGRLTVNGSTGDVVVGGIGGLVLNQNGGGADRITTASGSSSVLNLNGANEVTSNGDDQISLSDGNSNITLNGSSNLALHGGNSRINVNGQTALVITGGQDVVTLNAGAVATLDVRSSHYIHAEAASLKLHFTNDHGTTSDLQSKGGIVDAWTDAGGGIHATTGGQGVANLSASGNVDVQVEAAAHVALGTGSARVAVYASQTDVTAGTGDVTVSGGWLAGSFIVNGGSGTIVADSGSMDMTFIGGSGIANLTGGSLFVQGGSGRITASGNGVKSFTGGTGIADIGLADGARVVLGGGTSTFTEKMWGAADVFDVTASSVGNAIINGFRTGTDKIVLDGSVHLASQSVSGGATQLQFSNGGSVTLLGVTDARSAFA